MNKRNGLILGSVVILTGLFGIKLFPSITLGDGPETYNCVYDSNAGSYACQLGDGDFSCSLNGWRWVCSKEGWESGMDCSAVGGENDQLSCSPSYRCTTDAAIGLDHCKIDNGSYGFYDEEYSCYSSSDSRYAGICSSIDFTYETCVGDSDGYEYICYYRFSSSPAPDANGYYLNHDSDGSYDCMWAPSAWANELYLEGINPGTPTLDNVGEYRCADWSGNYYNKCRYSDDGKYFCPNLYNYSGKNINEGVYYLTETGAGNFICESDTGNDDYICSYIYILGDVSKQYHNCEVTSVSDDDNGGYNGYKCPISYDCILGERESKEGYICTENQYGGGEYYCGANPDYENGNTTPTWGYEEGPFYCYSNSILSRNCDNSDDGSFFCAFDTETHKVTIDANDNGYGLVNPSGEFDIASGTTISIDGNNILTIGGIEVLATPTSSTPEYTYSFSGWTNTCGDTIVGDCTITANFSVIANEYTITFVDEDRTYVYTGAYGSNITTILPTREKEGYTLSWQGNVPETMPAENITIVAQWTINEYTITFDLNGGTGTIEPITQDYNTEISEPTEPTMEGYTFAGWYDGNTKVIFPYKIPASDKTLTAHWNKKNSGLNGYSGGGEYSLGGSSNNDDKPVVDDKSTNSPSSGDNEDIIPLLPDTNTQPQDNAPDIIKSEHEGDGGNKPHNEQYSQEAIDAYNRAYANGLTKYDNISDARLNDYLNRSEMAKISAIFAMQFRGEIPNESKMKICSTSDLGKVENEMKEYIIQSCELGYMGYRANGIDVLEKFRSYDPVSLAEMSIILSRITRGNRYAIDENHWYQGHLWAVYEHGLIDNISNPFEYISRKDAFIMLYRLSSTSLLLD